MFIFIHICICSHVIGTTTHLYTAAATQRGWCIEAFVLILAQLQSLSLSLSLYIYIYTCRNGFQVVVVVVVVYNIVVSHAELDHMVSHSHRQSVRQCGGHVPV